jgi:N-glycosylase/DNA lyase
MTATAPFDLQLALHGHGWIYLAPHRFEEVTATWHLPLRAGAQVVDVQVRQRGTRLSIRLDAARKLSLAAIAKVRAQLAHMLRLHDDLSAFWRACEGHPTLAWTARRGAGRLLRSPTVFEDLMKLLFTTNCTWAATTAMTQKLVAALGSVSPSGARAFPTAAQCDRGPSFYREVVRAGYRAEAAAELAAAFAQKALDDQHFADPALDTATLRHRLLALRGFGPYAAGQALRLLGHYDDLALDSWCRATMAQKLGRTAPPSDRFFAHRYEPFGPLAGLAMWCELTAEWHGE